jgi:hypothetical protein
MTEEDKELYYEENCETTTIWDGLNEESEIGI